MAMVALTSAASAASTFSNMLLIILENTNYQSAIADPNLKAFASSGVLFSNWLAIGHPSQPNYIAMTSGSTNGITSDNSKTINVMNIADLLEAKGLTWKSYQENWPGNCFTGTVSSDNLYYRLANYFMHFFTLMTLRAGNTTHSLATRIFKRMRHVVLVSSILVSLAPIFPSRRCQHLPGTR